MAAGHPRSAGILDTILGHADASPARPAAEDLSCELDYAALGADVAAVATGLRGRGVTAGHRVCIHLPNSVDFVVAALAALWVGAIFVPLSVSDPEARIDGIVADCDPTVIVTSAPGAEGPTLAAARAVGLSELRTDGPAGPTVEHDPDRPVYAVYTSGTTGTPKGVLVTEGAFAAAVHATIDALDLDGSTRTLCVSAFHFDGSFATLFPTLVAGGLVVILPRDSLLFGRTFLTAVDRHAITYTGFSPSYLRLLLDTRRIGRLAATPLRVVALGGEASSRADIEELRAAVPELRIFNRYGPTETIIAVTHHEVRAAPPGTAVPIGTPHPGVRFYVLGEDGHPIEGVGDVGELWIGGNQLMAGYWGAPDLTAAVLRTDVVAGVTAYRTGDLVTRTSAGDYLYVDRADRVVKRSGVRISLVELTRVIRSLRGVTSAASTLYDDSETGAPDTEAPETEAPATGAPGGRVGIVVFVVTEAGVTGEELRRGALLQLPPTMLPDRIQLVDSLPLTPAGKIDERHLLADAHLRPRHSPVAPARPR